MEIFERVDKRAAQFINKLSMDTFKTLTTEKNNEKLTLEYNKMKKIAKDHLNEEEEGITRRYEQKNSFGGRFYSGNSIQLLNKHVRGVFMNKSTDIDMCNAQPTILLYLCRKHNIDCSNLAHYVNNRGEVL